MTYFNLAIVRGEEARVHFHAAVEIDLRQLFLMQK